MIAADAWAALLTPQWARRIDRLLRRRGRAGDEDARQDLLLLAHQLLCQDSRAVYQRLWRFLRAEGRGPRRAPVLPDPDAIVALDPSEWLADVLTAQTLRALRPANPDPRAADLMRYYDEPSTRLDDIGGSLGLSRERTRQLLQADLRARRDKLCYMDRLLLEPAIKRSVEHHRRLYEPLWEDVCGERRYATRWDVGARPGRYPSDVVLVAVTDRPRGAHILGDRLMHDSATRELTDLAYQLDCGYVLLLHVWPDHQQHTSTDTLTIARGFAAIQALGAGPLLLLPCWDYDSRGPAAGGRWRDDDTPTSRAVAEQSAAWLRYLRHVVTGRSSQPARFERLLDRGKYSGLYPPGGLWGPRYSRLDDLPAVQR